MWCVKCSLMDRTLQYSSALVLVSLLLILAGDVETNPGPDEPFELVRDNLGKVLDVLWAARVRWKFLGLALGVDDVTLEVISTNNHKDTDECFREMISKWLMIVEPCPTWQGLLTALEQPSVGCRQLAKEIADHHGLPYPYTSTDGDEVVGSDHTHNTADSAQASHEVLKQNIRTLEKDFNKISSQTYEKIMERHMDVDRFRAHLFALPIQYKKEHKNFFEDMKSDLSRDATIIEIWERLTDHWNFLNYTLLESLVSNLDDSALEDKMERYIKSLKNFRSTTRLCDFAEYCPVIGEKPSKADLKSFVVHFDKHWETCTLEELDEFENNIIRKFCLPSFTVSLKKIIKGSVIITWSLPAKIASSLREDLQNTDNREFCKQHRIKSMTIDGKECKYSPVKIYAAYLKDIYSHKEGKNLSAFKLARILKVRTDRKKADIYTRSTLRGDQDDVVYEKKHMEEKELGHKHWGDDKEPRLVLIEGAPGVGKTTFSEQCCYKWSQGQSLQDHTLLVLLPLRDNKVKSAKNLKDLFQHPQLGQAIAEEVEGSGGEGVALWLEAWDELEKDLREKSSVFLDLVHGRLLPRARIIITSRPWATRDMRESTHIKVDQHVEVVSTPKIQFSRLLRDEQKVGADIRDKFIDYVTFNPAIKAAMHTPITANIVAEVFQWSRDTESSPPATVTQLYTALTCKLLMQHLSSHKAQGKHSPKIRSLEELPSSIERDFEKLCRLAWEGMLEQKLTFSSGAVGGETLGLMCCVRELYSREDSQLSYHFIHLTLQEFLSAYHIRQLPADKQEQVIREHLKVGHLNQVVIFYFGLSRLNNFTSTTISEHISDELNNAPYAWLMECQAKEAVSNVLRPGESVGVESSYAWSPLDYFSLGYCIAHSQCQWTLNFSSAPMGDEGMECLCKGLSLRDTTCEADIMSVDFSFNALTIEGIQWLGKVPHQILQQIKKLDLGYNHLDRNTLDNFSQIIPKLTKLQVLSLSDNDSIGAGGAVELIRTLCHYKTPLRLLDFGHTDISEEDCAHLPPLLANTDLETLSIGANRLSCNSVASIMEGLQQNSTIKTLEMSNSQLSEENCTSLASVLQQSVCQLKELYISRCSITSEGAKQLAAGLTHNQSLTDIDLSFNPIGDIGAAAVGNSLQKNSVLTTLEMWDCEIESQGCVQLTAGLAMNSSLQNLKMSGNRLGVEGAKALSKLIEESTSLVRLYLDSDDSLEEEGVAMILSSLQKNTTLKELVLSSKFQCPADSRVKWMYHY